MPPSHHPISKSTTTSYSRIASIHIRAYLTTTFEDVTNRPIYGSAVTTELAKAWSDHTMLRNLLPDRLRARYDTHVVRFTAEAVQLDLFHQEDV